MANNDTYFTIRPINTRFCSSNYAFHAKECLVAVDISVAKKINYLVLNHNHSAHNQATISPYWLA